MCLYFSLSHLPLYSLTSLNNEKKIILDRIFFIFQRKEDRILRSDSYRRRKQCDPKNEVYFFHKKGRGAIRTRFDPFEFLSLKLTKACMN